MATTKTPKGDLRQGDVLLQLMQVPAMPAGCELVDGQDAKIILAWGEVTGHHHRIEDHVGKAQAAEIADAAVARAQAKARLWVAPGGDRYLEVLKTVHLLHEEHTKHTVSPGIYRLPMQVEWDESKFRRVAD